MTDTYTFLEYAKEEASRMWAGKHRERSIAMAERFADFEDFEERPINSYKPRHIHRFLDHVTDEWGLTNNTANHYAAMIIKVFKQAYRNQDIDRVPDFTWKKIEQAHRMAFFTAKQVDQIVDYFERAPEDNWMAQLVIIAANTGMRIGEILSVTPNTVFTNTEGKPYVYLAHTKNGDERYIYLNAKAQRALNELDNCPKNFYVMWKFYRAWKNLRRDLLNGDKNYVFHSLRHTFATRLANEFKLNNTVIAKMMGHRSLVTTSKYVKLMSEVQEAVCDEMGKLNILTRAYQRPRG